MTVQAEIQKLSRSALIELFVLDTSSMNTTNPETLYFHAGTNGLVQPVVWRGQTYQYIPIQAEGFDVTTSGTLPRPTIKVANVQGYFSALAREKGDLIGATVIRRRTFARFLDAVNFPGGVNPTADENQSFPDDTWFVEQKVSSNNYLIEWELSSAFDVQGVMLPNRQVVQNTCAWAYKSPECGYTGTDMFDKNDETTANPAEDFCSKRMVACKKRFPNQPIPFGGFPGAVRYV